MTFSIFVWLLATNISSRTFKLANHLKISFFGWLRVCTRHGVLTVTLLVAAMLDGQLTWLALGHDQAGGSRSAEQVTAL